MECRFTATVNLLLEKNVKEWKGQDTSLHSENKEEKRNSNRIKKYGSML